MQLNIHLMERYSTIKAHTIRIWERRHGLFSPQRSSGNRRHFDMADFRLLLDIAVLTRYGFTISSISAMDNSQRKEKLQQLRRTRAAADIYLSDLLVDFLKADIVSFEQILDEFSRTKNIRELIDELIIPFMERVQLLSYADHSSATHFAVTAIRKKLLSAIEQSSPVLKKDLTVLLFLPKGQHFDLILLYLTYQLQAKGFRALYLGTNISMQNLQEVMNVHRPAAWVTYLPPGDKTDPVRLRDFALEYLPADKFLIATADSGPDPRYAPSTPVHYSKVAGCLSDMF